MIVVSVCILTTSYSQKADNKYPTLGYLESLSAVFDDIVQSTAKIEIIADGHDWSEGPVWLPEQQCLIYSDVPRNIAYRWSEADGISEFLNPSGNAMIGNGPGSNGITLDRAGNLFICQTGNRRVVKIPSESIFTTQTAQTLAHNYQGKKFNAPNDLVVDGKGNTYFTDPNFSLDMDQKELDFQGVYRINTEGKVALLNANWPTPNGIALSPDEQTLYFSNSKPAKLISMDLKNGTAQNEKVLLDLVELKANSISKMSPDGMCVRKDGIIFLTGPDGILVIDPEGTHLGTIRTDRKTSNCTLNEDESVLYVTSDDLILRVKL